MATIDDANALGRSFGKIKNAALYKWPAIIDPHDDGFAVFRVGNL